MGVPAPRIAIALEGGESELLIVPPFTVEAKLGERVVVGTGHAG